MSYPSPTPIYHITHIKNLEAILHSGSLIAKNFLDSAYQNVAYGHIQDRRASRIVPIPPMGNLHDYVPFYFCPRSPMLYAIYNPIPGQMTYEGGQTPILHLVTHADRLGAAGLPFTFTDRHAVLRLAAFFTQLPDLDQLNWAYIQAQVWHSRDPQHPDRKELKQAEFLVHRIVPWEYIEAIGVINSDVKATVEACLDGFPPEMRRVVQVKPDWYY